MKKLIASALGLLGLLAAPWAVAALPISHWTAGNGAQIYFMEAHNLPIVDIRIDWDGGSRRDPEGQAGTADALALMLGKGVAAQGSQPALDENQLADAWADLGTQPAFGADDDRFSASLRSLSRADILPKAVTLLARQIAHPSLSEKVWAREQSKAIAALEEADTRAPVIAQKAFTRSVYGASPYGAIPSASSLRAIQTAGLRHFAQSYLTPCQARISLVGDLSHAQAEQLAAQLMAGLPASCPKLPALAATQDLTQAKTERITRPSAQTQVLMGQIAIARNDPDFFAFLVGNHILGGGGFSSRLTEVVREQNGLCYSIYSTFNPLRDRGAFLIGFQTRPAQAARAIALSQQVLRDFVQHGPSAPELQAAKANLMGGFPARMDSNAKLLDMLANIAWNDLPLDYLDHWTAKINAVQISDIQRAFARIQPQRQVLVEVGP